ncbi:MAG TPA: CocE/NonD family hydrolase [Fimbriimonadaceae bacterium]|nr:CocE/NonD family hydrolase [Fimbriimonadaceae bacterium]
MRLRAMLCLAALAPLFAYAQQHLNILVNGSKVGEADYDIDATGAFAAKSTLDLGSMKLTSKVSGHMKDGKLVDSIAESSTPGGDAKVVYANGRVDVTAQGKTNGAPWQDTTGCLAGNLCPAFMASSLLEAEKQIRLSPATKTVQVNAFLIDAGIVIPLKITALSPKTVLVKKSPIAARRFNVDFAGVMAEVFLDPADHVVLEDVPTQHIRFAADGWEKALDDPIAKYPELSQATYATKTEKGVHMKTRDGVDLVCDIVRPDDDEKHPAILVRTPYGRGSETTNGEFYASRGYAYVTQDCRGREDSGGKWDPFVNEGPDGYDTIQWIASQPWSDGKVGMIGGSYAGYVQWAAAVLDPPALKCIVPEVSPPDAMRNIPYDNGVFCLNLNLWWAKIVAGRHTDFTSLKGTLPHPEELTMLPLDKLDKAVLGEKLDFYQKWLARPTIDDWKGFDFTYHLADAKVPALHISGNWDGDEIGTHLNWATMRALHRNDQWIIFGPWVHAFNTNHSFADQEYGPTAIIELDSVLLRWFDTWLKGKDVGLAKKQPKVSLFVTGANVWTTLPDWPAPSTPARTLYLGKGSLTPTLGKPSSATYRYDPKSDKVPKGMLDPTKKEAETTKLSAEELKEGLTFKTAPLKKSLAITGPLDVKLRFKTSAKDTDFFVLVVDISPNGDMQFVGLPGKVRGSYLGGMDKVRPLTPGKTYLADIIPWDFAHEFKKGHRIGILVRSSMFPTYSRNLGTADPIKTATRMVVQRNTILMGKGAASSFTFRVLWEK